MYCLPAVIYIGLSIIGLLYIWLAEGTSIGMVILELLFFGLFAWFLDYLCRNGYTMASWILVLFPFVFIFALAAGATITHAASMSPASY